MDDFHKIWIEQCEAARSIREEHGIEKALGYLIGEKLMNFVRVSDQDPEFMEELPQFVSEVKRIFSDEEIRGYLENIRRVGSLGHTLTDEQYETFRSADPLADDAVNAAEKILILDRIKGLLLA